MRSSELSTQRGRSLKSARQLARSGAFTDADNVLRALSDRKFDARDWVEDRRFRAQLDKLCELARARR